MKSTSPEFLTPGVEVGKGWASAARRLLDGSDFRRFRLGLSGLRGKCTLIVIPTGSGDSRSAASGSGEGQGERPAPASRSARRRRGPPLPHQPHSPQSASLVVRA